MGLKGCWQEKGMEKGGWWTLRWLPGLTLCHPGCGVLQALKKSTAWGLPVGHPPSHPQGTHRIGIFFKLSRGHPLTQPPCTNLQKRAPSPGPKFKCKTPNTQWAQTPPTRVGGLLLGCTPGARPEASRGHSRPTGVASGHCTAGRCTAAEQGLLEDDGRGAVNAGEGNLKACF